MAVLESRGLFWWAHELVADEKIAPDTNVSGTLRIDDDGAVALELDGVLPSKHGIAAMFAGVDLPADVCIRGLLKGTAQHVLLSQLARNGGSMSMKGLSYERYVAFSCLISSNEIVNAQKFEKLEMPLSGYEEWLGLNAVTVKQTARTTSAKYKRPATSVYRLPDQTLTMEFDLQSRPYLKPFNTEVSLKQAATATIRFREPATAAEVIKQYQLFEDLLVLFTVHDCALDWPRAVTGEESFRIYFRRVGRRSTSAVPKFYECVLRFPELRGVFGEIWQKWRMKREEVGPGLFLYLGTRRGIQMYLEHRFVNLIWAIESLHRATRSPSSASALTAKIERILNDVTRAKDRKWLENKLEHAAEPPLSSRISQIFSELPLNLDKAKLRAFSDACARLRNDMSHFGGQRAAGDSYDKFLEEVHRCSSALSILYQLVLLTEIGVDGSAIKKWVFDGPRSYPIRKTLGRAKLVDEP